MSKGILILLFASIFLLSNAILVQESFTNQRHFGDWSNFITAQEQTGNDPSTYFLCGVSFREMKWKKLLYNCDCRKKWYIIGKQTCKWCDNYFTSMRNGFKAKFCHSNDWNKQIQQIFETGSTESGQWRQIKCPKGQYVSKTAVRFGYEYQTDLGLTGISMKCDSISSDYGKGAIQQQTIGSTLSAWTQNRYGTFVNGIKLKYVNKDKLSGILFGYSGVPVIKKVSIDYQTISFKSEKVNLDYSQVANTVGMDVQKRISINKPVPYENTWSNGLPYTGLYEFFTSAKIEQRQLMGSELKPFTKQFLTVQNFALNKPLKSITFAKQQSIVIVPPCRLIKLNTTLTLLSTVTPFNMTIEFANRITQEDLAKNSNIKGEWNGTIVGDIKTDTTESIIEVC